MTKKYPKIIYKYRDWNNDIHRSILNRNELFLARPSTFNDPFDFKIRYNFDLLDTPEKCESYLKRFIEKMDWQKRGLDYTNTLKMLKSKLDNKEKWAKELDHITTEEEDNYYGIACFSKLWNNILMWSHYANKHTGFCVGFEREVLLSASAFDCAQGQVIYDTKYPLLNPLDNDPIIEFIKTKHFKSIDWKYEKEFRLTKLFYPNIPTDKDRIIMFPDDAISEVVLGLEMPLQIKKEIAKVCHDRKICLYQVQKKTYEFRLTRTPITVDQII